MVPTSCSLPGCHSHSIAPTPPLPSNSIPQRQPHAASSLPPTRLLRPRFTTHSAVNVFCTADRRTAATTGFDRQVPPELTSLHREGGGGSRGHWPPITPPLIALRSAATAKPWTPIGVGRGSCRGPRPPRSPPAHHLPYMGHNGTVESYWSTQTPWKSFYSLSCQLGRIYPTKSDIFIRFQRLDSQHRSDMSDQPDLSGLHRIPETWQPA
jgi:hypothetical protein